MARKKEKDLKGPRRMSIPFPSDLLKEIKIRALKRDMDLQDWVREVCKEHIQREDSFID